MKNTETYRQKIHGQFISYLNEARQKLAGQRTLKIDLHCHDFNSDVPDERLARILGVPETWTKSEELIRTLQARGTDVLTITNHNNARSCFTMQDKGIPVLTAAEFSCMVPDLRIGIHVLTYGFTPAQEVHLFRLRENLYDFLEYTANHDIPTMWAHPFQFWAPNGTPPLEEFNKLVLMFERFEAVNGQRSTWQNLVTAGWLNSFTPEVLEDLSAKHDLPADRYCRRPHQKSHGGGSDDHFGVFAGQTGTLLACPDDGRDPVDQVLQALRTHGMAPYGMPGCGERLYTAFLDYFCQLSMNMTDPGLVRLALHRGTVSEKLLAFGIANGMAEIKRHRTTMRFLRTFHDCLRGKSPGFLNRLAVPRDYRKILSQFTNLSVAAREGRIGDSGVLAEAVPGMLSEFLRLAARRLERSLNRLMEEHGHLDFSNPGELAARLEIPSHLRGLIGLERRVRFSSQEKYSKTEIDIPTILDDLRFPFLASTAILGAIFASHKVLNTNREFIETAARSTGTPGRPRRILWLTDSWGDRNGVSRFMELARRHVEEQDLQVEFLVTGKDDASPVVQVVRCEGEIKLPVYDGYRLRIPDVTEIMNLMDSGEYDRIICSTEGPMAMIALFIKHAYNIPAWFYVHTDWMDFMRMNFDPEPRLADRVRRLLRAFYQSFDGILVLNSAQKAAFTTGEMALTNTRVVDTAHWVDRTFRPVTGARSALWPELSSEDPVLLFVGRLSREKGIFHLRCIYEDIRRNRPGTQMVIAGTGPDEEELRQHFPEAEYRGWVHSSDLPALYSAADLLILPSGFDTFGFVILEALSCGLPVAALAEKGAADLIEDGVSGCLAEDIGALQAAVSEFFSLSLVERRRFSAAAKTRAESFSAGDIMQRLLRDTGAIQEEPAEAPVASHTARDLSTGGFAASPFV